MKNMFHSILKITSILFLILSSHFAIGQIQINSHVVPLYLNRIVDYASRPELMVVTLTNTLPREANIQLTAKITGDNGMSAWVKPGYKSPRPITIGGGQTITLNGNDIAQLFNINNVEYTGISREDMVRGLGLKEGNYQLCIQALNYNNLSPMSAEQMGCTYIRIADTEPPRILSPQNEQILNTQGVQAVSFTWSTPSSPSPGIQYKLKLVELVVDRDANDAIQTTTPLYEETLHTNMLLYGPAHPALVKGRRYAMLVQAIDVTGKTTFRNGGKSEVVSFVYNNGIDIQVPSNMQARVSVQNFDPDCSCKFDIANLGGAPSMDVKTGSVIKVNHFDMYVTAINSHGNGKYSGEGTIVMPGLGAVTKAVKLRVMFTDILINKIGTENRLIAGQVIGKVRDNFGFMPQFDNPDLKTMPLGTDGVDQLDQYFKSNSQQLISNVQNSANTLGFELPLGVDQGSFTIGITNVVFDAKQSWFDAITVLNMIDAFQKVSLSGRGICINSNDFCGQAELFLTEDLEVPALGLTLKGGFDNEATRIQFDKKGFKELIIGAAYRFPTSAPLADLQGNPLVAALKARTDKSWSDWVGELTVPQFRIANISDITFGEQEGTKVVFDHSDKRNVPSGMPSKFESGDPNDEAIIIDDSWTGIYIPKIAISLPGPIKNANGKQLIVQAEDLIFHQGITGKVTVNNILSLGDGSLDGWYVSVDKIALNFWKNSFKSSQMMGKLVLPPSGDEFNNTINQIDYTCTLTKPQGGDLAFQMIAQPKSGLEFSALWTTVTVDPASNITVKAGGGESFKAAAVLHGSMLFKTDIKHLPDLTLGRLTFKNMRISSQVDPSYFDPGQIEFSTGGGGLAHHGHESLYQYAYQQPKGPHYTDKDEESVVSNGTNGGSVLGFSITETKVSPYFEGTNVGFRFGGSLQLVKGLNFIPKATFQMAVFGNIGEVVNGRKAWKSVRGKLEYVDLSAQAKLGPVEVEGKLYYQDIEAGGIVDRGLGARITAKLPTLGGGISMQALFGSRNIVADSRSFNYFYLDASLDLPTPITMFPGTAIFGFAGGFYYNMSVDKPQLEDKLAIQEMGDADDSIKDVPNKVAITSFSGNTYVPQEADKEGSNFGIQAGVYFGLLKRNTLEGLLSLDIGLNSSSGFEHFSLNGKAAVMTGKDMQFIDRYNKAMAKASMHLTIKMENGSFESLSTGGDFTINYPSTSPLVKANGALAFYIDNKDNWYFHMGKPTAPNKISFANFIESEAYFQVGSSIDPMPPLPAKILELIGQGNSKASSEEGSSFNNGTPEMLSSRNTEELKNGGGFNFGAKVEVKASPKFAIFYLDLYAGLGFDFHMQQLADDNAACSQQAGDWYARGQAFMGAEAGCGVNINIFGLKKKIEFVRAGLAAALQVGAPTPMYAKGTIGGRFSVLDGLIAGDFNMNILIGEECSILADRELKLISDIKPAGKDISTLTRPSVAFNYPLNRDFVVPITTDDNVKYEVYRFRPNYVNISVKKNNSTVYTSSHFSPADAKGLFSPMEQKYYSVYMLALNDAATVLDPKTTYAMKVEAKVKILKASLLEDWTRSQAHQAVSSTSGDVKNEVKFQFVNRNNGSGEYVDIREESFTTDEGPKNIPLDIIKDMMPIHRHGALPYAVTPSKAYLKLSRRMEVPKSFSSSLTNAKAYARIVTMNNDNEVINQDLPITFEDNGHTWSFARPNLLPNQKYAIRIFMKGDNQSGSNTDSGTKLVTKESFGAQGETKLNSREIISNSLVLGPNEQELFSWYFNTGAYKNYTEKLNKLGLEYLYLDGKKIDVKTPEINLSNFANTNAVVAAKVDYEFFGTEYFNSLDYGDWTIGDIFPHVGNQNVNVKLGNRNYLTYLSDVPPAIPEFDRIVQEFMNKAFNGQKSIQINNMQMPWNAITGGIEIREHHSFVKPSKILPQGLYGIDYGQHNYGSSDGPVQEEIEEQEASEMLQINRIWNNSVLNNSAINANIKGLTNIQSASSINSVIKKHVYTTTVFSQNTSGKGALNGANMVLDRINSVKNLGYPVDMVKGMGVMIDQISTWSNKAGSFKPTQLKNVTVPAITVR